MTTAALTTSRTHDKSEATAITMTLRFFPETVVLVRIAISRDIITP
jgi:hypothetical protein